MTCYGPSRMAQVAIDDAPLYIQGFGRSGTTHLLNLFAQDPSFGTVSTFQAIAAPMFLIGRGRLERLLARAVPATRPMDEMAMSLALPQEEEVALANTTNLSWAHHLSFPNRARAHLAELERLYAELALPGWERVRGPIADYLGTLSGYRKNTHRVDQATIDAVDRKWGFAVDAWGYRPPDTEVG